MSEGGVERSNRVDQMLKENGVDHWDPPAVDKPLEASIEKAATEFRIMCAAEHAWALETTLAKGVQRRADE